MEIWLKTPRFRKVISVYFVLQKNPLSLTIASELWVTINLLHLIVSSASDGLKLHTATLNEQIIVHFCYGH